MHRSGSIEHLCGGFEKLAAMHARYIEIPRLDCMPDERNNDRLSAKDLVYAVEMTIACAGISEGGYPSMLRKCALRHPRSKESSSQNAITARFM